MGDVSVSDEILDDDNLMNRMESFAEWRAFKSEHGKEYGSQEEEERRFQIFQQNKRLVERHNEKWRAGEKSFSLAMNHFGDMTKEEFASTMNGFRKQYGDSLARPHRALFLPPHHVRLPRQVDWRTQGYVTPVKNQGQCGSCWSFSATGALEGQHFRKAGKLVSLSEQNLIDCSTTFGNQGCNGGLMDQAFQYVKVNGGIDTELSYPYEAMEERCRFQKSNVGATDAGFMDIAKDNETALRVASATTGPISVAIDASHSSFQFYKKGVYVEEECSPVQLDHGVLVVGYGVDQEYGKYWIVKNSWSAKWGENGYIRMARNHNNMCGIASSASFPLV